MENNVSAPFDRAEIRRLLRIVTLVGIMAIVSQVVLAAFLARAFGEEPQHHRYIVFAGYTEDEVAKWQALYDRSFTDLPTEFAPMIKDKGVELVAAPHMKDLLAVYGSVLPQLRAVDPTGVYVFVVKPSQEREFMTVASMMYGGSGDVWKAQGATAVDKGFAIALEDEYGGLITTAQHEMMHLIDCGTWHDGDFGAPLPNGEIRRYPGAEALPWCV